MKKIKLKNSNQFDLTVPAGFLQTTIQLWLQYINHIANHYCISIAAGRFGFLDASLCLVVLDISKDFWPKIADAFKSGQYNAKE